jgi:hypothetical protein
MIDIAVTKTIFTIFHLMGVALGAGGAFLSDSMFISSVKDNRFSKTEIRFLKLASKMVWIGIILLVLSGIFIFFTDTEYYLASSKFLAKMSIVLIIILNGIAFHFWHLPLIHQHENIHFPTSNTFTNRRMWVLASGAISIISWLSALILGSLQKVNASYFEIMAMYIVLVFLAVFISWTLRDNILPKK